MPSPSNNLGDIICEYGQAFRGDWGSIDGRGVKLDMETIASYVKNGKTTLTDKEAESLRYQLGLCPNGHGHWYDECEMFSCDSEE